MSSTTPAERILAVASTLANAQQRAELEQSVRELVGDPDAPDRDHLAAADAAIRDAERLEGPAPASVEQRSLAWRRAIALVLRAKIPTLGGELIVEQNIAGDGEKKKETRRARS